MSLTTCPYCKHKNSAMRIYKEMNFKHRCSGDITECEKCHKMMKIIPKNRSKLRKIIQGFLWMFPAIVVIGLVLFGCLDYRYAITLMIFYHILAFWAIIYFCNYSKTNK